MLLSYSKERLADIIKKLHNLTGINISITDIDYHCITRYPEESNAFCRMIQSTAEGKSRCNRSDAALYAECMRGRCAVTHRCHAGLCDTAVPIENDGVVLGYIIFGQVINENMGKLPFDTVYERLGGLGLDRGLLKQSYDELKFFGGEKIDSAAEIVTLLTKYICLGHIIEPKYNAELEGLIVYINDNLTEKITVSSLCERFHVSQNTLYNHFHTYVGCTVGEYVDRVRMKRARELLITTDLPVYEICSMVGIDNYQYFCRHFKQKHGETPLKYRKSFAIEE